MNQKSRYARANNDPATRERIRAARRRYWAKLRADPERHARYVENQRITRELSRGKDGRRRQRRAHLRVVVQEGAPTRLPVKPFRDWLIARMDALRLGESTFAERVDIEARTLYRVLHESRDLVSLDIVDLVVTRDGSVALWELYPELYADEDAA